MLILKLVLKLELQMKMKMKKYILLLFFVSLLKINADSKVIPYTMDDRDRMMRLEVKLEEGLKTIDAKFDAINSKFDAESKKSDARFEALQRQIDFTNNLILTLIAGLLGSIIYMWWDRRAANAPIKDAVELEAKKNKNIVLALKEYANINPEFKNIFDRAAIL